MKIHNKLLSVVILCILAAPTFAAPRFQVIEGSYTWQQAKVDAESRGGRLAVLKSQELLDAAAPYIASFEGALWIGLTDEAQEGQWKWITGEALTFSNWWTGQPSNSGGEDYGHINWKARDGLRRWNDANNDDVNAGPGTGNLNNLKGYLLEYPPGDGDVLPYSNTVLAVEFQFSSDLGKVYTIESSTNMDNWTVEEYGIAGTGALIRRFYSISNNSEKYYRALVE
jgi:hypothetical protein